jgi:tRNA threonylcarbamoyladenosine biosynthesis protein TsaB
MKALAIDSSVSKLTISAKNEDNIATLSLDIGMHQSEKILPSIEYVMTQVQLQTSDLDYTTLCSGPGSFTGLRLAFSVLKALELSDAKPIYGVPTLQAYIYPFESFKGTVLCAIDARKDKFYALAKKDGKVILDSGDYEIEKISEALKNENEIFIVGPDANILLALLQSQMPKAHLFCEKESAPCTTSLFTIAEDMIAKKIPAMQEYDGPVYLRASEAEEHLTCS